MDVVLEGLMHHEGELGALGAVAVVVLALVIGLGHGHLEKTFGPLDLGGNLGKVGKLERSTVFLNDFHEVDVVEQQVAVCYHEFVLREVEGLVNQVDVLVFHSTE